MQIINIAQARKMLPKLANDAYFKSKSFLITKRGIPIAKIVPIGTKPTKSKYTAAEREKAINNVFGMWKNRWKGKSSVEVARILRKKAWKSHAR